jgi:hypothetical protein
VIEALTIFPNVWLVYRKLGKLIGVSYGAIWNIARAENIKLIRFDPRWLRRALVAGDRKFDLNR